jgi:hypothetical protein
MSVCSYITVANRRGGCHCTNRTHAGARTRTRRNSGAMGTVATVRDGAAVEKGRGERVKLGRHGVGDGCGPFAPLGPRWPRREPLAQSPASSPRRPWGHTLAHVASARVAGLRPLLRRPMVPYSPEFAGEVSGNRRTSKHSLFSLSERQK